LSLAAGIHFVVPASLISLNGEIHQSLEEFHGFRFSDAPVDKAEITHEYHFTTASPEAMHFGYGRNVCPGIFFASIVVKAFTTRILAKFGTRSAAERPMSRA